MITATACRRAVGVTAAAAVLTLTAVAPANAADTTTGTFRPGSPNYTQGGTAGPFNTAVAGTALFTDSGPSALTAAVNLTGLAPNTRYVTVAYKDGACLPTPGLTAFPSGAFTSDATGSVHTAVPLNPRALNPLGSLTASQVRSVSVRAVVINGVAVPFSVPNNPLPTTPTVPNVAYVEACDTHPSR